MRFLPFLLNPLGCHWIQCVLRPFRPCPVTVTRSGVDSSMVFFHSTFFDSRTCQCLLYLVAKKNYTLDAKPHLRYHRSKPVRTTHVSILATRFKQSPRANIGPNRVAHSHMTLGKCSFDPSRCPGWWV